MPRPTGVSVLAILYWIATFFLVITGIIIAAGASMASLFVNSPWMPLMTGMGAIAAILFFIMAAIAGFVGYGLWTLREWARIVTIVIAVLSLLGQVAGLFLVAPMMLFLLRGILRIVIDLLILWYLMQPQVRAAFVRSY